MIKFFNVSVAFFGEKKALDNISLKIDKGEFVYITGASGAGKSTLLKLIYADLFPTRGVVLISNKDITNITERSIPYLRRNIGVIFQDFKLLENKTVFENIFMTLEIFYMDSKQIEERIFSLLRRLGLFSRRDTIVKKLSGGEKQRVAIARALINEPSIVLADEPTGNLDPERAEDIIKLLKDIANQGSTVLVATHDKHLIEKFGGRTIYLKNGKIEADSKTDEKIFISDK
ncbi:cell division ATP-binding protein FtsE [Deferribacterales bacterium Es71-Z0220]|jgi:cell division transport system ATP-binding protein|uniref:cell division ATP-binding protein FtsE n=1 Tax=Deferrivibrio essentukiensis TaxID=2880922 RepID=UPI001F605A79|nr:cell division ATP-binding protein FtsE [Deferrivibrio essentukiensis]MBZ4672066.1 Sigma 54 interacting domain protein [Deferribacteraceae bacterium]MCB4205065.1 cell division ATP-binding protein FtsE [Deferrivibrio essentukiensis]